MDRGRGLGLLVFVFAVALFGVSIASGATVDAGGSDSSGVQAASIGPVQVWLARYHGAGNVSGNDHVHCVVVDRKGYVYVTGGSYGSGPGFDYATVKYDRDGNEVWVARYNGPGNGDDRALALAVDKKGNVYVTGYSEGDGTGRDYATIKYDWDGNELWVVRYDGPGNQPGLNHDQAQALAVDRKGNVYVTGYSEGDGTGQDYATIKYDSEGNQTWVARYDGPGSGADSAYSLAVDRRGNVYVTGTSQGDGSDFDFLTIKYDRKGRESWVARHDGPGNGDDGASSLVVDRRGNVYVAGTSQGDGSDFDFLTIKYDQKGRESWVARYDGPGNGDDGSTALAVGPEGRIYVTGYSEGDDTGLDYATIGYSRKGDEEWVARYDGPVSSDDVGTALDTDIAGNVYVTGYSQGDGTGFDFATLMYDRKGRELWIARYNGPGNDDDYAYDIAVARRGDVYVTGIAHFGSAQRRDYTTIKYTYYGGLEAKVKAKLLKRLGDG